MSKTATAVLRQIVSDPGIRFGMNRVAKCKAARKLAVDGLVEFREGVTYPGWYPTEAGIAKSNREVQP